MGILFWKKKRRLKDEEVENGKEVGPALESRKKQEVSKTPATQGEPAVFEFGGTVEAGMSMQGFCRVTERPGDLQPCVWKVDEKTAAPKPKYHIEF